MAATSRKRRSPATGEGYFIRSLSAPMRVSATGELCSRISIGTDTTLTIGRSKKACDVTFEDARVSRKHCQLRFLPHSNSLVLLNGSTNISHGICSSECVETFGCADANRCTLISLANTKALKQSEETLSIIHDLSQVVVGPSGGDGKIGPHNDKANTHSGSVFHCNAASGLWKPPLNGIFVNGHAFEKKMVILMPGDEVSLVGPTEGGNSLDIDCPEAVGFVVEIQPAVKKAQLAAKCLSLQMFTKHIAGDNFSGLDMCNKGLLSALPDADMLDHHMRTSLDNKQNAQPDTLPNKLLCHKHAKHSHLLVGTKFDVKPPGGSEPDTSTGDSSTACSKSSGLADATAGRTLPSVKIEKSESTKRFTIKQAAAQFEQSSCPFDLDSKVLSTLNLVKASIQLRCDLLKGATNEHSHSVVGLEEPLLMDAKEKFHFSQQGNAHQKSTVHSNVLLEYAMPNVNTVEDASNMLGESQKGNVVCERHTSCIFGESVREEPSPCRQVIILENCGVALNENRVAVPGSSDLVCKEGSLLKEPLARDQLSKDVDANMSRRTRTLLVSQTDVLSDTLENACSKMEVLNCSQNFANTGDCVLGAVNGKFSKEFLPEFHAAAEKEAENGVGEEVVKTGDGLKPALDSDSFRLMFGIQSGDVRAATGSQNVYQVEEELPRGQASLKTEDISFSLRADERCSIGGLTQGLVVKGGGCNTEAKETWDFQKSEKIHSHSSELDVANTLSNSYLAGPEVSRQTISNEGFVNGDQNLSVAKIESGIENKQVVQKNLYNIEQRVFKLGNTSVVQENKNSCAVRELEAQKMTCTLCWPQPLGAGICTSGLPAAKVCHSDSADCAVSRDGDCSKGEASQRVLEPGFESPAALHNYGGAESTTNARLKQVCDDSREGNAATELAIDQLKSFYRLDSIGTQSLLKDACFNQVCDNVEESNAAAEVAIEQSQSLHRLDSICTQNRRNNSCLERVCDNLRESDTTTEEVLEHSRSFHRHVPSCMQSLPVSIQGDDKVEKPVLNKETCSIGKAGYYLNMLKDAVTGVSIDHSNAVCLWDLLALTNDVLALFIATFTYDLEWFLSSASLSRDTPVTVACHNAKRCWSMASKDRCEKPYLDWPNVTLVYPPFPRSNAFGKGQGIGCHHPKVFLLRRTGSLRVVVSSANLTFKQWFNVTNNVWWQDFPRRHTPDFRCLFRAEEKPNSIATPDFAAQLAIFLAALLVDAPSEAHWVTDLAAYDFSDAAGSLVASVPGLHQPLYQHAPQFLRTLNKDAYSSSMSGNDFESHHLGVIPTTVAGIKYRFGATADRNGTRIRSLAAVLNDFTAHEGSTMPVLLKRAKFLKADPNAVSVIVTSQAKGCSQDLFLQEDLHDAEINTMENDILQTEKGFIKLGFLPREVARWLAVLCDRGFFSFAACIWPSEALAVASGQCNEAVKLALYVFQGPKFLALSPSLMTSEERGAFSGLLKSLHNTWGLWRLEKVLGKYNWIDSQETDFYVASSSIGTSLDAKFLAAFAAAAGRRAESMTSSQDSDPQWGCWTAEQEAVNPSIGIVFPSIDRVRRDNFTHYGLLCFAESAWLRIKSAKLLHDAVPYPTEREGFPMHIKADLRRRFMF